MAYEFLFANNATTTLAQAISATATVITVASGDGDLFPSPTSGQAFAVTLVDASTGLTNEICYCTSRSGDELTVIRGQEGKNALAWSAGDTCANYITANVIESWLQESDLDGYLTETAGDTRYLRLDDTATQEVVGPVTYSGLVKVPAVSDWTTQQVPGALDVSDNFVSSTYGMGTGDSRGLGLMYSVSVGGPYFFSTAWNGQLAKQSDLNTVSAAAATAQSTANTGVANAANALSTAEAAQTIGTNAQTSANNAQSTANAAVNGGTTSSTVKRGEELYLAENGNPSFGYDGGTVQLALLSQLVDDGAFRIVSGTVGSASQGSFITFSTAFSSAPVVLINSIDNSDINCHPYSISETGFYYHGNAGSTSDINYIAYGPK